MSWWLPDWWLSPAPPFPPGLLSQPAYTRNVAVFQFENRTLEWPPFVDEDGNVIPLTGHSIELTVYTSNGITRIGKFQEACAISGTDNNIVSATIQSANTQNQLAAFYEIRDLTTTLVLFSGIFAVIPTRDVVP